MLERAGISPQSELEKCLRLVSSKSTRGQIDARSCAFNLARFHVKTDDLEKALGSIMPFARSELAERTSGYDLRMRASLFNLVADIQIRRRAFDDAQTWIAASFAQYEHQPSFESQLRLCLSSPNHPCHLKELLPKIANHRLPQLLTEFFLHDKFRTFVCDQKSKNGKVMEACGLNARKNSEYESAKGFLLRALELLPSHERFISHANIGGILHIQGDAKGAIDHYSKALRIKPNDPVIEKNIALLKS